MRKPANKKKTLNFLGLTSLVVILFSIITIGIIFGNISSNQKNLTKANAQLIYTCTISIYDAYGIQVNPSQLLVGKRYTITASGNGNPSGNYAYTIAVNGGNILNANGSSADWQTPSQPGTVTITVNVRDYQNGSNFGNGSCTLITTIINALPTFTPTPTKPGLPDMEVLDNSLQLDKQNINNPEKTNIIMTVKNSGQATTYNSGEIRIYDLITGQSYLHTSINNIEIAPGFTQIVQAIQITLPEGTSTIVGSVDEEGVVPDSSRSNNKRYLNVTIPPYKPVVTNHTVTVMSGQSIIFSYDPTNPTQCGAVDIYTNDTIDGTKNPTVVFDRANLSLHGLVTDHIRCGTYGEVWSYTPSNNQQTSFTDTVKYYTGYSATGTVTINVSAASTKNISPTPSRSTITLNAIADTTVKADYPTKNYGSETSLQIDGSPVRISYLKFDLSPLQGKTITSASLRLYVTDTANVTETIKDVANTGWNETGITYNTRPALSSTTIQSVPSTKVPGWVSVDVSSWSKTKAGAIGSFGISSSSSYGLTISSRESSNKPQLVITYR